MCYILTSTFLCTLLWNLMKFYMFIFFYGSLILFFIDCGSVFLIMITCLTDSCFFLLCSSLSSIWVPTTTTTTFDWVSNIWVSAIQPWLVITHSDYQWHKPNEPERDTTWIKLVCLLKWEILGHLGTIEKRYQQHGHWVLWLFSCHYMQLLNVLYLLFIGITRIIQA